MDPATRGDPVSPLRWTCLSTRNLAGALTKAGHPGPDRTVARLLREQGYSLQGNAKVAEGAQHGDRDAQFRYIAGRASEFMAAGDPVVSVDAKKKEKIGNFANGGAESAAGGPARAGERARLPLRRGRQGDPLRHLRPGRQRRVGLGGHRPRHLRVRRADLAPLVGMRRFLPATPPRAGC